MKTFLLLIAVLISISSLSISQTKINHFEKFPGRTGNGIRGVIPERVSDLKQFQRNQKTEILRRDFKINHVQSLINTKVVVNCDDERRFSYIYDNSGFLTERIFEMQSEGNWSNDYRCRFIYDNSGNCLEEVDENWSNGVWVISGKYTYTYDGSGHCLTEISEQVLDSLLENYNKNIYTYDDSGNLVEILLGYWSYDFNDWLYDIKRIYAYDNSGNILTDLEESWADSTGWQNLYRYTHTYDNSGNCLTSLTEAWADNNWVNSYRYTGTYDNSGNNLSWAAEKWKDNNWINLDRFIYTYDNNTNCLSENYDMWYYDNWANYYRYINSYDNFNNLLTSLYQQPEYIGRLPVNWINGKKYNYTYDNTGRTIQAESFSWDNNSWAPFNGSLTILFDENMEEYHFSASHLDVTYTKISSVGVDEKNINSLSFRLEQNYPNPFNPTTRISFSIPESPLSRGAGGVLTSLKVYDILGNEVATLVNEYKAPGNYEVKFDGSSLSTGVYIYRLTAGSFTSTRKLMILK